MIFRRRQQGAFFLASSLCVWSLFLLLSTNGLVDAANVDGRVHLPREHGILEPTKIVLNQGEYTAFSRFDGSDPAKVFGQPKSQRRVTSHTIGMLPGGPRVDSGSIGGSAPWTSATVSS